jgi:hypothetical protein
VKVGRKAIVGKEFKAGHVAPKKKGVVESLFAPEPKKEEKKGAEKKEKKKAPKKEKVVKTILSIDEFRPPVVATPAPTASATAPSTSAPSGAPRTGGASSGAPRGGRGGARGGGRGGRGGRGGGRGVDFTTAAFPPLSPTSTKA